MTETLKILSDVYEDSSTSRTRVFEWHKQFVEGRKDVEDDPKSGRPCTSTTDANIEKIWLFHFEIWLHFDNWCQQLMPTSQLRSQWPSLNHSCHCQWSWDGTRNGPHHFGGLFGHAEGVCLNGAKAFDWGAESSTIEYMPRHSSAAGSRWQTLGKRHHRRQVMGLSTWSRNKPTKSPMEKCILIHTKEGPHATFASESDVDHLLWPSLTSASWVCFSRANSLPTLLQRSPDSPCQQNSSKTKSFLSTKNLDFASRQCSCSHSPQRKTVYGLKRHHKLHHPRYSIDLAPCDFFLFPKLKGILKRTRFKGVKDIKTSMTNHFETITNKEFSQCFKAWSTRMKKFIKGNGKYVEGDN